MDLTQDFMKSGLPVLICFVPMLHIELVLNPEASDSLDQKYFDNRNCRL